MDSISILTDIKKSLSGIPEEEIEFDQDILLHINSALSVLNQLGIGPKDGLYISDSSTVWDDLTTDKIIQGLCKEFILYSVKLSFDSSTLSSFVLSALEERRKELTFRLTVEHDRLEKESE